jgi:hypothetical protein
MDVLGSGARATFILSTIRTRLRRRREINFGRFAQGRYFGAALRRLGNRPCAPWRRSTPAFWWQSSYAQNRKSAVD